MQLIKGFKMAARLLDRSQAVATAADSKVEAAVKKIIDRVKAQGDKALFEYALQFDGARLRSLEVTRREIDRARLEDVDPYVYNALAFAADRVEKFHRACLSRTGNSFISGGLGQQVSPLERVGIYVPGGTASYPSTVLMTAIPARVAGVKELIMATPCRRDGKVPAATLAAARIAGVDRIFKIGGAQAIAALAFGTGTVPRVDKICGPGNIYVMTAKKLVYGAVAIDALQGPSEVLVIADGSADPAFCAADLIAQSEHDPLASSVLVVTSESLAVKVQAEIEKQLRRLKRGVVAAQALQANGRIVVVKNTDEAVELANLYAPEHLSLMVRDARKYIKRIKNAGCICAGQYSPVVLGDYVAGPSHALPTGGSARFSSPLTVQDFLKFSSVIALPDEAITSLGPPALRLAESEGLTGHVAAVSIRLNKKKKNA